MKMGRLFSFERIFPLQDTYCHHIDKIDQIDSKNGHSGCNLPSGDDSKRCYKEGEHDRSRITHNYFSRYISTSEPKSSRNHDC